VVRKAAEIGLYSLDVHLQHHQDETGMTLPVIMEEIFWGYRFVKDFPVEKSHGASAPRRVHAGVSTA
jgi:hypothetical protein